MVTLFARPMLELLLIKNWHWFVLLRDEKARDGQADLEGTIEESKQGLKCWLSWVNLNVAQPSKHAQLDPA